jgi:hypothetical protein
LGLITVVYKWGNSIGEVPTFQGQNPRSGLN